MTSQESRALQVAEQIREYMNGIMDTDRIRGYLKNLMSEAEKHGIDTSDKTIRELEDALKKIKEVLEVKSDNT